MDSGAASRLLVAELTAFSCEPEPASVSRYDFSMGQTGRKRSQGHHATDRAWMETLQYALDASLSEPTTRGMARPLARVLAVSPRGSQIEIELRFKAEEKYCCSEPGCSLPTFSREWWRAFRKHLNESSERNPPPLTLRVDVVVEPGAKLQALESIGLPMRASAQTSTHGPLRERDAK